MKKKRTRVAAVLLFLLMACCLLAGCGEKNEENNDAGSRMFYLNQDGTKIVSEPYEPAAVGVDGLLKEYIGKLSEDTGSVDYRKVIPDNVKIEKYECVRGQLTLYFSAEYLELSPTDEVLCRGAVVHTMMQIPGILGVSFSVDGLPLKDANGVEVGVMTNDTFVENPGEKINTISEIDIALYFSTLSGDGLVREHRNIYYSSNISQEKLVMEQLLAGPSEKSENAKAAIPASTGLISVSVMDGVCFVNLDENFLAQDFEVSEEVVIYSIVNSLTELPNVNTVQISVNGKTDRVYREKYSLKEYYQQNLDLVVEEGARVKENDMEEKEKEGAKLIETGK